MSILSFIISAVFVKITLATTVTNKIINVTAITTQIVDIELTGYTGRANEISDGNITIKAQQENSLAADAAVTLTENVDVPESILSADEAPAASASSCCAPGTPNINIDALTSLIVAELKKMM